MRIPFAVWTGLLALISLLGLHARDRLNFGVWELRTDLLLYIGGGWLALMVLLLIANSVKRAATLRPDDLPSDVARELDRHPED